MADDDQAGIRTLVFCTDRSAYARARVGDTIRRLFPPMAIAVIVFPLAFVLSADDPGMRIFIASLGFFLLIFVLAILVLVRQRIFAKAVQHAFESKRHYVFGEDTIYVKVDQVGESTFTWRLITGVRRPAGWTFLMSNLAVSVSVPDSAFASESDLRSFRDLVARKIGPATR